MTTTTACPKCGYVHSASRRPLTERQREVLRWICNAYEATSAPPSYDEIAAALQVSKQTVAEHVEQLEARGWITRSRAHHRSIVPVVVAAEV